MRRRSQRSTRCSSAGVLKRFVWHATVDDGIVAVVALLLASSPAAPARASCMGDCDLNGAVKVNELVMIVNIALDTAPVGNCTVGDANGDDRVSVAELVGAVNVALGGCSSTPTPTPEPSCTDNDAQFDSTWDAIQTVIFNRYGCTESVCHGAPARQGGLDLSPLAHPGQRRSDHRALRASGVRRGKDRRAV